MKTALRPRSVRSASLSAGRLAPAFAQLVSLALLVGCAGADPTPVAAAAAATPTPAASSGLPAPFVIRDASASPITFERMTRFPEPGWQVPRSPAFTADGKAVMFLAGDAGSDVMALHRLELATRESRVLLRASELGGPAKPLSREEELRRERQRQKAQGITSYALAKEGDAILVPQGGDIYLRRGAETLRLTETAEPELDPKLCGDARRVAFVRGNALYSLDVGTKRETLLAESRVPDVTVGVSDFNAQEELDEPSGFFWSPDCSKVAYLEVDERGVEAFPVRGVRAGKPDLMMQRYPFASGKNPLVRLGVVDVATRKTTWLSPSSVPERYFARVAFSEDSASLFFVSLSRDQKTKSVQVMNPTSGATRVLASESASTWVPLGEGRPVRNGHWLWTVVRGGHSHLELVDVKTGERRALTEGAWDVERVAAVDGKGGRVFFVGTKDGALERHLYAVPLGGGATTRLTREPGVHHVEVARDGHAFVDVFSALERLPEAWLKDDKGEPLAPLPVTRDADLDSLKLRSPEPVELAGPSGERLHGLLLTPRDLAPLARHPAVVVVYGGPGVQTVQNRWSARLYWQHLADRGFVVFQLDNRGSSGRGHDFESALYGKLGEVELADQLAGRAWLASQPFVDPTRIGIYGHSYGGFMAALAMLKAPGVFRAGVAAAPVTDWRGYDAAYTDRYMGLLPSAQAGFDGSDLTRLAGSLSGRLLLIHGLLDENVHYDHTANLASALVAANEDFEMLVLADERHGYRSTATRSYVMRRITDFLVDAL